MAEHNSGKPIGSGASSIGPSAGHLVAVTILSIFLGEVLVMTLLWRLPEIGHHTLLEALLDGLLVAIITLPAIYMFFYIPLKRQMRERAEAEQETARLAMAIQQMGEAVMITNIDGKIEYVNPAFEQITGYSMEEARKTTPRLLKSGKHDPAFYEEMWRVIRAGHVWKGRLINKTRSGVLFDVDLVISPLHDDSGKIINYIAIMRDVTSQVRLEAQARHSQKIETLGALAGGVAHDFNNILSSIIGFTELAMDDLPAGSTAKEDLLESLKAGRRARDLVKQILTFSRRDERDNKPLQLHLVVKECVKLLRPTLPPSIKLVEEIDTSAGLTLADPTQINQVVMNLLANAQHAMANKGGDLSVRLRAVTVEKPIQAPVGEVGPGKYLTITVSDTGHGINKNDMERIFDPFFTTKEMGEGTGLGLAIVHGIVTSCGGNVMVESEYGEGSRFTVYLPRLPGSSILKTETEVEHRPRGEETVLLVDDEESALKVLKKMIEGLGYRVVAFSDPLEALARYKNAPNSFQLVITDHNMPGLNGLDLARKISVINPGARVLMLTGVEKMVPVEDRKEAGLRDIIIKPVTMSELAEALRQALEKENGK